VAKCLNRRSAIRAQPQTIEAAVLMLADSVEGLPERWSSPNHRGSRAWSRKLPSKSCSIGQFDECHLTLEQLRTIEDSLIKSLTGVYHGRIKYTRPAADRLKSQPSKKQPFTGTELSSSAARTFVVQPAAARARPRISVSIYMIQIQFACACDRVVVDDRRPTGPWNRSYTMPACNVQRQLGHCRRPYHS